MTHLTLPANVMTRSIFGLGHLFHDRSIVQAVSIFMLPGRLQVNWRVRSLYFAALAEIQTPNLCRRRQAPDLLTYENRTQVNFEP
jgi:hypothetical protein